MAAKTKKPVSYPRVVIAGATRGKFHGRRGSPNNPKPRFAPASGGGAWDAERVKKSIYDPNWDHKGIKSDGALAFTRALKEAGVLLCLQVALSVVPRAGYDGYFNRRDLLFGLLRGALVEADDTTWAQAQAVAESAWKEDNPRVHRALAALFPERQDWGRVAVRELLAEYKALEKSKGYAPATYDLLDHVLLAGAGLSPERLLELVALGFFEFTPQSEPWLIDMVDRLGVDAAPVLAAFHLKHSAYMDYHVASTRLLGTVESAETADACARRLGDWKKQQKGDVMLLKRMPALAIPALEAEVARHKKSRTRPMAWGTQRSAGADRAAALLKELLAERGAASAPGLDRSALPEGLRDSPWSAPKRAVAKPASFKGLAMLPFTPRVVIPEDLLPEFERFDAQSRALVASEETPRDALLAQAIEALKDSKFYVLNAMIKRLTPRERLAAYQATPDPVWRKGRYPTGLGERLLHPLGAEAADACVRVLNLCIHQLFFQEAELLIDPRLAARLAVFAGQKKHRYRATPLLTRDPEAALIGLIHAAVTGKGKPQAASVAQLAAMAEGEHAPLLEATAARYGDAVAARVNTLLGRGAAAAPAPLPSAPPKMPTFWSPASLPPLVVDGAPLPLELVRDIGGLMKLTDPARPPALLRALKERAEPASLTRFCAAVMAQWVDGAGTPAEAWAATWMGALGGDEGLSQLADQLELWCRGSRHHRAFAALEAFVAHPSDRSAALLDQIARKSGFDGLSTRAAQALHRLARARGMDSEDLLDTIVPDCGLADCPMTLDFGQRSFTAGFDAALSPWVRDAAGKALKDVPRPGKKDASGAGAARQRWMKTKAAVRAQSREQLQRMERALVRQRRWTPERWRALAAHPLLGLLARGLLWGSYQDGALKATFRVDEDGAPVNIEDAPATPGAAVGLVHPVQLDPAALQAWGAVFADYEIAQPFPQLQRPGLTAADAPALVARAAGVAVNPGALLALRRAGWARGGDQDQGFYDGLDGPTLSVRFSPGLDVVTSANSDEPRTLVDAQIGGDPAALDPVALSEDLAALAGLIDRRR